MGDTLKPSDKLSANESIISNVNNQRWLLQQIQGQEYKIVNKNSGKCLDVPDASTADQAPIQQYTCHDGNNQRWLLQQIQGQEYKIVNKNSGKCLDVPDASTADQAPIQQYTCLPTTTAHAQGDDMQPGEMLDPGQSIKSANGVYTLTYQSDGNLVLYKSGNKVLWETRSGEFQRAGVCIMQDDGNLVIYNPSWQSIWSTGTRQHPGSSLYVQDDGNVVIYGPDNTAIWSTDTPAPFISDFTPTSGQIGETVTINGSSFHKVFSVEISHEKAKFKINSPEKITATIPATAAIGASVIRVFNPTDEATSADLFRVYKSVGDPDAVIFHKDVGVGGDAFSARVEVTLLRDGTGRFVGHAHTSGIPSYDFYVVPTVRTHGNRALAMHRRGHVNGSLDPGSPDFDWDERIPKNPLVAKYFDDFQNGWIDVKEHHESNITGWLEDIADFVIKWVVGGVIINPGTGLIIFLGVEAGSLIATGSLVPGARIIAGTLWLAGPAGTFYALVAEGIAALGSRTRRISQEEYDFAKQVFKDTLPSRDRLILTDTIGAGNRAFTFPRFDGKITLNMGPAAFNDPRSFGVSAGQIRGEVFIHELVHAWQIHHTHWDIAWLADALATQLADDPYNYGPAGPAYGNFNLEQQAQIVSDWFAGRDPSTRQVTKPAMDQSSPYFRYIEGNIWLGVT
jgi:hypothetical protein